MSDKRYQVFISSTFEDLKEERRAVHDVVIAAGDFPVQMESFPASDEEAFDLIKSLLAKCDYYILIIAGRYDSLAEDGLSYTHKEFRYADEQGVPILVMLHSDRGKISADRTERTEQGRKKLAAFIEEASKGRTRKTWSTIGDLKAEALTALVHAKQTKPRVGWVRGDTVASVEALEELNEVRKENAKYRETIGHLEIELALPPIPAADEPMEFSLLPVIKKMLSTDRSVFHAKLRTTWISAFPIFYSGLKWYPNDDEDSHYVNVEESLTSLGSAFAATVATFDTSGYYRIAQSTYDRLASYYIEVGLMLSEGSSPFTEVAHRLARRHHITGGTAGKFTVVDGSVELIQMKKSMDDEIPF